MYYLFMNKDIILGRFTVNNKGRVTMLHLDSNYHAYLPVRLLKEFELEETNPERVFTNWLNARVLPSSRETAKAYIEKLGELKHLNLKSKFAVSMTFNCVTFTDTYWVKEDMSFTTWNSVSMHLNYLGDALADTQLSAIGNINNNYNGISFPNAIGMLNKAIIRDEQGYLALRKYSGDLKCELTEYIATIIGNIFFAGYIPMAECRLNIYKGKIVSDSRIFTSDEIGLMHMSDLDPDQEMEDGDLEYLYKILPCSNEALKREIVFKYGMMLIFDYIINNKDRHGQNFGFLYLVSTGEIIGLAPIYDSGASLGYSKVDFTPNDKGYYFINTPFEKDFLGFIDYKIPVLLKKLFNIHSVYLLDAIAALIDNIELIDDCINECQSRGIYGFTPHIYKGIVRERCEKLLREIKRGCYK